MKNAQFVVGGGECGDLVRSLDWSTTPLGSIDTWPVSLLANVNTMLNSPIPYVFMCGSKGVLIYNNAYAAFAQDKHPAILGMNVAEAWPEIADFNLDIIGQIASGKTIELKDQLLRLKRDATQNKFEDVYIDLTYGPIFDDENTIAGVTVSVFETTEKVKSEQNRKVLRNEAKIASGIFDTVVNSMVDHVYYFNKLKRFMYANDSLCELVGATDHNQIVGKRVSDIFGPEIYEQIDADIDAVFTTKKPVRGTVQITNSQGKPLEFDYTFSPVVDSKGAVIFVSGSSRDVTEQNALERSRQETIRVSTERDMLLKVNAVKDDFISIASHELRTPATAVKQYIGMVLEGYAGDVTESQRDFLTKANISNERQLKTISDLLKVARIEANKLYLHKSATNLGSLLKTIVDSKVVDFAHSEQTIELMPIEATIKAHVDADNLRIAIENILDNARKYSPAHAKTVVELQQAKNVIIRILDNGVGINESDFNKLFNKFERIPNHLSVEAGGTGLGLYWSHKIVSLHGGEIIAKHNQPTGMIFEIHLPQ